MAHGKSRTILRDGNDKGWAEPVDDGESYDLIVVGAGISGLASAYFYRKFAGQQSKILVLDNHDDFGGHAKRNEFHAGNDCCSDTVGPSPSKHQAITARKQLDF